MNLPAVLLATLFSASAVTAGEMADTIYSGGAIITIDDSAPRAEAVAVKDGRILAVGTLADVDAFRGDATESFDLDGRAMLPGFVDSHGHMVFGGFQAMVANLLAPPDGEVTDIASLQATLSNWARDNDEIVKSAGAIVGFGYDNAQLAELRHPTREDLDAVSTEYPIIIVHQSGHLGVTNSKGLEMAGIDGSTENPSGGVIRRRADGEPNGVLEEYAFFPVFFSVLGKLGEQGMEDFARAGSRLWASYGYTTAQDGRTDANTVAVTRKVGSEGDLPIDVVAYPDVLENKDFIKANVSREYENKVRVGGCKLTIDGSPQGFTALRDRPYYDPVGEYPEDYAGYAAITREQTRDAVNWCYENGFQILVHANGEGASDMLIAALEEAQAKFGKVANRPVLIHGQLLREDQIDSYKRLGVFPSLFPMHTFYWGDWHSEHTVGPEAARNISPTGWLVQRGMKFGTHHDAPVALPDSMRVLSATVTRRTRSGMILGSEQRVDVMTALKAMTLWPAWQHFEEDRKGSIEVGKLADFVILSDDPTAIDPDAIADIDVLVTIKEGSVIFERDVEAKNSAPAVSMISIGGEDPHAAHHLLDAMYGAFSGKH
ncbi:amidohydrolase [Seongchinamella sediminis]|uniref:Amidohydrolase n=2 Tax=Seongchinamella sediminis TaxID=2283635 RepID=A0A3L7E0R9_9GAMM|nr:amidohydrolase [Seongchinamella sediminis]